MRRYRAGLAAPLMLVLVGCLGGPGQPSVAEFPAALQAPSGQSPSSYEAWIRHTQGAVGEDLFGALLPGGGVVFSSNRFSPHFKLCVRPPRGSAVRRITDGVGHDLHPAPAADGRIAFVSTRSGAPRLYLLANLEDSSPRRLGDADADALHPSWSPDGTQIAYARLSPVTHRWEVWIIDLATGQQRFLTEGLFPEFHPRGARLVFQRARRRDENWFSIWTIRLDGTHEQEIISGKDWGAVNPTWSPGGEWIAFNTVARSPANRGLLAQGDDIWCVRADGELPTRLTARPSPEWNPRWGTNGRLYFTSLQSGETSVWSLMPEVPEARR